MRRILAALVVATLALPLGGCLGRNRLREAVEMAEAELKRLEHVEVRHEALRRERLALRAQVTAAATQRGVAADLPPSSFGNLDNPPPPCRAATPGGSIRATEQQLAAMDACVRRGKVMERALPDLEREVAALKARLAAVEAPPQQPLDWGADCSELDDSEKRLLGFVFELAFPSSVEEVRAVARGLGEPQDMGQGNSSASLGVSFRDTPMSADFSFHDGQLVSHGTWTRGLDEATAARLYRSAAACLLARLGTVPERSGPLENGHFGFSRGYDWIVDGKSVSLSWEEIYDGSRVRWGAQAASPSEISARGAGTLPPR